MRSVDVTFLLRDIERAQLRGDFSADLIGEIVAALEEYRDRAMPLGLNLAGILDGSLPLLDAAAERERRAEAGKALRQVTHQSRAKGAREAVAKAADVFGYEL